MEVALAAMLCLFLSMEGCSQKSSFDNIDIHVDSSLQMQGISVGSNAFDSIVFSIENYISEMKLAHISPVEVHWEIELEGNKNITKYANWDDYKKGKQKFIDDYEAQTENDLNYQKAIPGMKESLKKVGKSLFIFNDAYLTRLCDAEKRKNSKGKYGHQVSFRRLNSPNQKDMLIVQVRSMLNQYKNPQVFCDNYGQYSNIILAFIENKWQVIAIGEDFFKVKLN